MRLLLSEFFDHILFSVKLKSNPHKPLLKTTATEISNTQKRLSHCVHTTMIEQCYQHFFYHQYNFINMIKRDNKYCSTCCRLWKNVKWQTNISTIVNSMKGNTRLRKKIKRNKQIAFCRVSNAARKLEDQPKTLISTHFLRNIQLRMMTQFNVFTLWSYT